MKAASFCLLCGSLSIASGPVLSSPGPWPPSPGRERHGEHAVTVQLGVRNFSLLPRPRARSLCPHTSADRDCCLIEPVGATVNSAEVLSWLLTRDVHMEALISGPARPRPEVTKTHPVHDIALRLLRGLPHPSPTFHHLTFYSAL